MSQSWWPEYLRTPNRVDHSWRGEALCAEIGLDIFFANRADGPGARTLVNRARAVCAACPVREACLEAAMREEGDDTREFRWGVRGGLIAGDRYRLYLRRRESAA